MPRLAPRCALGLAAAVLTVAVVAAGLPAGPEVAGAGSRRATTWIRPVAGPVVRPFAPPAHRYGPGHLGVDLAARPGTPVRAAGPGTVTFAGTVGARRHVVIAHAGGLRTTYSFLAAIAVVAGQPVRAGQRLGTTGGADGRHHDAQVVHVGLRRGGEYLDPMLLFGPLDLPAVVRLAPVRGASGRGRAERPPATLPPVPGARPGPLTITAARP
jgi:murein DD-endopeptidase MepM/ murein hydrolase activator NlpD